MNSESGSEILKAWYAAVEEQDLGLALRIASDAHQQAASAQSPEDRLLFERLLRLSSALGANSRVGADVTIPAVCSFCCEPLESKRVVRGPGSAICASCIELAVRLVSE